jgi:hypothetical protein
MSGDEEDKDKTGSLSPETVDAIKRELIPGVGYNRPPKHTQFQPGRSGNPKGRPRAPAPDLSLAEQPTLDGVLKASQKLVKIREGDRILEVPLRDALTQSIIAAALKGNARSQGLALDMIRQAEQKHAREVQERNELWSNYKEVMSEKLAQAAAAGEPAEPMLPHPDDIIIDRVNGPRFLGPLDEEEEARMKETIAFCETLIMQDVLDERSVRRRKGTPRKQTGAAMLMYYALERPIPPRLRLSEIQVTVRWMTYDAWPMRRLLKEVHQAWQKLGHPKPRGWVMPDQSTMAKNLALWWNLITSMTSGYIDANALARGEPDDATLDILDKHGIRFVPDEPAKRHSVPLGRRTARGR